MLRKAHVGFTLIELMVTIAVAALLLAVAIPSYRDMVLNNCLTTKTNALVSAMQLARSSAVTLRDDVFVGALPCHYDEDSNGTADGACASADEFGTGIVVFRDVDGDAIGNPLREDANQNGKLDGTEDADGNNNGELDIEVIKIVRFSCAATVDETSGNTTIAYDFKGNALNQATLNICDSRDSNDYDGRQLTLSLTGRPHTEHNFTCP